MLSDIEPENTIQETERDKETKMDTGPIIENEVVFIEEENPFSNPEEEQKTQNKENTSSECTNTPRKTAQHQAVYSQNDLSVIIGKIKEEAARENVLLLEEVTTLEEKYETILSINAELNMKLHGIELSEEEVAQAKRQIAEQQTIIEGITYEKQQLQITASSLHSSFHELRVKYEEQKRENKGLMDAVVKYKEELLRTQEEAKAHERRFNTLKEHAENMLKEANEEIENTAKNKESEMLLLKAKHQKTESKASSLEKLLESKERENKELVEICDELMNKIERGNSSYYN